MIHWPIQTYSYLNTQGKSKESSRMSSRQSVNPPNMTMHITLKPIANYIITHNQITILKLSKHKYSSSSRVYYTPPPLV